MNDYLLSCQLDPVWSGDMPPNWLRILEYETADGTRILYESTAETDPTELAPIVAAGGKVLGAWQRNGLQVGLNADGSGTPAHPLDAEFYDMRPLGNNSDGSATEILLAPNWQGWLTRKLEGDKYYPSDNEPFDIEVRHWEYSGGWSWRAEMSGDAYSRDPSVYAMAVYGDEACTEFLYTLGGFVRAESFWQTDETGQLRTVWATDGWDGDRKPNKAQWNLGLLFASLQHGHQTLRVAGDGIRYLFWENSAGGGEYVDSGSTWMALIGGNTFRTSDTAPFSVGSQIRIDGTEMQVTQVHTPGAPGILVVDLGLPDFSPGDAIFVMQ